MKVNGSNLSSSCLSLFLSELTAIITVFSATEVKRFLAALVGYLATDENELLVDYLGRGCLELLVLTSRPAEWIKFRRIRQLSEIFQSFYFSPKELDSS